MSDQAATESRENKPKKGGANVLESRKDLTVGEHTLYNGDIRIKGAGGQVFIGKYCAIAENCRIIASNHNYNYPAMQNTFFNRHFGWHPDPLVKAPIVIGSDVWIGDNVIITAGAQIGDGSVIAAGAVVTGKIPPYAIAGGIPARVIKNRFPDDIIALMLELKWWEWPEERIERNRDFFTTNLNEGISAEEVRALVKQ